MEDDTIMSNIRKFIDNLHMIDCHEHLQPANLRKEAKSGLFDILHYLESDLVTAGMPRNALQTSTDVEEKAQIFSTYFERAKNTAYAKAFTIAMNDLYQMNDWSAKGILELNEKIKRSSDDPSWYDTVLREKSGIDVLINLVQQTTFDDPLYRSVMFLDYYIELYSKENINQVENLLNRNISKLTHYLDCLQEIMDQYVEEGVIATKLGFAYRRSLSIEKPTFHEAEQVFNRLLRLRPHESLSLVETKPLQDYLVHEVIQASMDRNLPIQIHTGHHEPSVTHDGNVITNSKVADLIPLLLEYPNAQFILLHAGLPYVDEYLTIIKNFPNVYADMTWVYIISPTIASKMLHQLIEMVPWTKIQGFGGDYNNVESIYAHAKMARNILSNVLEEKISEGYLTENEAQVFAKKILYDNPIEIYNLKFS